MCKMNGKQMMKTYENMKNSTATAVENAKDITVRPKINAALEINSKKQQKQLFGASIHFDKEFSLLKVIGVFAAAIAGAAIMTAAIDAVCGTLFGGCKKCGSSDSSSEN